LKRNALAVFALLGVVAGAQILAATPAADHAPERLLTVADLDALRTVSDPTLSPDGAWVAYSVRTTDTARDKRSTHLWMTSWDARHTVQLTQSEASEHSPGWSPDGRALAFLSNRGEKDGPDELWLLDRDGGDAQQLTQFKGDVTDYAWSADGRRLALVVTDDPLPGSDAQEQGKSPPPIVIDRFYFKEDETGYLSSRQLHLYVLDVATRRVEALTSGRFTETYPSWSPDGSQLAFVSKRTRIGTAPSGST
jgi:Tol biopolymer transport system component